MSTTDGVRTVATRSQLDEVLADRRADGFVPTADLVAAVTD